jgi:hypothetical protein
MVLQLALLASAFNTADFVGYAATIVLPLIVLIVVVRGIDSLIRQSKK